MRIGIDARFYGADSKGLGRYTQKLIENLEKIYLQKDAVDDDLENDQYFVFLRKENFAEYQPKNKNFHKVEADYKWYSFSEQIDMPRLLYKYKLDLVHFPHFNVPIFYRKKFIVTIHDLILLHFPTIRGTTLNPVFYWLKFLAYKITIGNAVKKAKKIIAVSNFTRSDILTNYSVSADKVAVTYEAGSETENYSQENVGKIDKYGIMKPYLLYVGNAYPHKNLEKLVKSWQIFDEKQKGKIKLVLVGKKDYFYNRLREIVEENKIRNIIFAGFVLDDDLDAVYKNAIAYIFPSLYEGFGLPPLEAMKNGLPVISSNHKCLREIMGDSAYYFDAQKKEDIVRAIEKIISDENLRQKLTKKGFSQIAKYSWKKMAKETLKIYKT